MTQTALTPVFSAGKAVMSLLIATCVERGLLDYDRPVAELLAGVRTGGKGRRSPSAR